jgi:regulator of RNase E activity RraA
VDRIVVIPQGVEADVLRKAAEQAAREHALVRSLRGGAPIRDAYVHFRSL